MASVILGIRDSVRQRSARIASSKAVLLRRSQELEKSLRMRQAHFIQGENADAEVPGQQCSITAVASRIVSAQCWLSTVAAALLCCMLFLVFRLS